MKNWIVMLALLVGVSAQGLEAVDGAKKDIENFKKEANAKIETLGGEIKELQNKAKSKGDEASKKTIAEIEKSRDHIKAQISALQDKGQSDWKKVKENLSDELNKLNTKIQEGLKN